MRLLAVLFLGFAAAFASEGPDWRERVERAFSLGAAGAEAVPELLRLLDDPETVVRATAAAALGRVGPAAEAAVEPLRARLADSELRCAAARALARIVPEREDVAREIAALLASTSDLVREEATRALAGMGETAVRPLLDLRASRTDPKAERDAAARALARMGTKALPGLVRAIGGEATRAVRWAAILSVGEQGPAAAGARDSLLAVAGGPDAWNAVFARAALVLVTGEAEPHVAEIRKALDGKDAWAAATQAIVLLGPRAAAAAPDLLRMLDDPDRDRRYQAATALGELGPPARGVLSELTLRDRKPDDDPYVRGAIRDAIDKLQSAR